MKPWLLYAAVLLAYLPGLIVILKLDRIGRLPVVLFCFLGLFVINAMGSILVLIKEYSFSGVPLLSVEYPAMLVGQALLFYLVTGPYVFIKSHPVLGQPKIQKADRALVAGLVAGTILIIFLFYYKVGGFLIVDLLSGELNARTMPQYRAKKSTGVEGFLVYRFGFLVLPSIVASILTMMCLLEQRIRVTRGILILLCFIAPLLLADKAGILRIALVMLITYVSFLCASGKTVIQTVNAKMILALAAAFVPTLFIVTAYYGEGRTILDNLTLLGIRIFGAHSESLAGIVALVKEHGFFYGSTLPTIHGLLPHDRIILEDMMHLYLVGLPGKIPVPALGEGFANFGWLGFILFAIISFGAVVLVQEFFLRIRLGLISHALMSWYAYLALMISTNSIFATLISLIYTVAFGIIILAYLVIQELFRIYPNINDRLHD